MLAINKNVVGWTSRRREFQLHCTSATPSRLQSMMRRLPSPAPAAFRPRNMNIHKRFSAAARHAGVGVARSRTPPIGRRITRVWAGRVAAVTFYLSVPGSFDLCRRRSRRCREFVNHLASSWRASLHRVPPHCCAVFMTVNFTPRITADTSRSCRSRACVPFQSRTNDVFIQIFIRRETRFDIPKPVRQYFVSVGRTSADFRDALQTPRVGV